MTDAAATQLQVQLDALRAAGAAPSRLWRAEALLRRMQGQDAAVAALLAGRVQALLDACTQAAPRQAAAIAMPPGSALTGLLAQLGAGMAPAVDAVDGLLQPSPVLEEARLAWRAVRARSQLQQALAQSQEDAGPLNSSRLLLRALEVMQAASPDYLECFLAYLDLLVGLEPLAAEAIAAPATARGRKRRG